MIQATFCRRDLISRSSSCSHPVKMGKLRLCLRPGHAELNASCLQLSGRQEKRLPTSVDVRCFSSKYGTRISGDNDSQATRSALDDEVVRLV